MDVLEGLLEEDDEVVQVSNDSSVLVRQNVNVFLNPLCSHHRSVSRKLQRVVTEAVCKYVHAGVNSFCCLPSVFTHTV